MINLKNKKIAIYGGSFNPIHIGHLITGFDLIEKLNYDYVIYIPANIPSHKKLVDPASQKHRLKMVKLSISGVKQFLASDIEIKKGGISYTIDTIRELKRIHENCKFGLVFGDDLVNYLSTWKEIDILSKISQLICMNRNNIKKIKNKYNIKWLENRIINISSSEIRKRIKNKLPINFLVTDKVKKFIYKKKLYV